MKRAKYIIILFLVFILITNAASAEILYNEKPKQKSKHVQYIDEMMYLGFYKHETKDRAINARNAVIRFQSDCNLLVDGDPGKEFQDALVKRMILGYEYKHPDIIAKAPTKGIWIVINKSKRILTVYEGKRVVKKYPIAIGKPKTATPEGKYKIKNKIVNPTWIVTKKKIIIPGGTKKNPLGKRWLGLSVGRGNFYGIHGNNEPRSIGKSISNGCIRMINADIGELFNAMPVGTPVWIGTDETLINWGVRQRRF